MNIGDTSKTFILKIKSKAINMRQAIQINNNVTEIMKLPCVLSAQKRVVDGNYVIVYTLFGDTTCASYKFGETIYANVGDWLIEGDDGNWTLVSDEDFQKKATLTNGGDSNGEISQEDLDRHYLWE